MKDQAIEVCVRETTDRARLNRLRDYLQHVLLRQLFERDLLDDLVFHGGTALRIVHDLPRFSEDLDFHLTRPDPEYSLGPGLEDLQRDLEDSGYRVSLKFRSVTAVQSGMFGFEELLYECGLSHRTDHKLRVKLEIDTKPPPGFGFEKTQVDTYFPYVIQHHDRASFLAGKLHAILQRRYAKGRDFYDLFFYLNRWNDVTPNIWYLTNALAQTGYDGPPLTEANWKALVSSKVREVDWEQVQADVAPFLLRAGDLKAFRRELLLPGLD